MISSEKLGRFIIQIQRVLEILRTYNTLFIHQRINESYYMQKEEELKILKAQLEESQKQLEATQIRINDHYKKVFINWRKDARWLNQHIGHHRPSENISG